MIQAYLRACGSLASSTEHMVITQESTIVVTSHQPWEKEEEKGEESK